MSTYPSATPKIKNVIELRPQAGPQEEFLCRSEDEVLYGGAKGGGKSFALLLEALRQKDIPGYRGIIFRRTYPKLQELIERSQGILPGLGAKWNGSTHTWTFSSGAIIRFGHCQNEADKYVYQGHEYHFMGFDQLEEFTESQYLFLIAQCRCTVPGVFTEIRSTANPGGIGHCLLDGDVLTPDGWKDIKTFSIGDPVYTVKPDGNLVPTLVSQVHRYDYHGDLLQVDARGLSMTCTPEHRVAKVGGTRQGAAKFSLVPFQELPGQATILRSVSWEGKEQSVFTLPKHADRGYLNQPDTLKFDDYLALLGWFLSEGYTVGGNGAWRFGIAQLKKVGRIEIECVLKACGFSYKPTKSSFEIHSQKWTVYLKGFGKCREKYIPADVKTCSPRQLRILFDALMGGDGHWVQRGKSGQYYTISRRLADDVAEVAIKLGYVVSVNERQRPNRDGLSYCVNFRTARSGGTEILTGNHIYNVDTVTKRCTDIKRVRHDGPVYCIGIDDTHSFVVRQRGSVWVSGNSWVYRRFMTDGNDHEIPPYTVIKEEFKIPFALPFAMPKNLSMTRVFIPATVYDNRKLLENDPQYLAKLMSLPEKERKALLEGNWHVFAGQYFSNWSRSRHIIDPIVIPKHWIRFLCMDYGSTAPFAALWGAVDEEGFVYFYREYYASGFTTKQNGQAIADLCKLDFPKGGEYNFIVIDPSAFSKNGQDHSNGEIIFDYLKDFGSVEPGSNERISGWQHVKEELRYDDTIGMAPGMYFFKTCVNTTRTIPALIHDDLKPEDLNTKGEDHAADAVRYGIVRLRGMHSEPERVNMRTQWGLTSSELESFRGTGTANPHTLI